MKSKIWILVSMLLGFCCCDKTDNDERVILSIVKQVDTDTVSSQAGHFTIKVFSNGEWFVEAISDGDWVEISPETGFRDQDVQITYAENTDEKVRTVYISFSTVDTRRTTLFSQFGQSNHPDEGELLHQFTND